MGTFLMGVGILGMFGVWIYTTFVFFATGQMFFALLSLVVPPADIVLPFLISPELGSLGLGAMAVAFVGSMLTKD